ncbi:MAG: hypothetical protein WC277_09290 [Bacilli bacterium]
MDRRDIYLRHCVELTCPNCGHMIRVARCQCDLDADHLVELYRREIILWHLKCHICDQPYSIPSAVERVNTPLNDDETEAQDMARVDDLIAAAEQGDETGYDGARADHSDCELTSGDLTAADVSWRARHEAAVKVALRGARIVDTYVTIRSDGGIAIEWIAIRLPPPDDRYAQIRPPEGEDDITVMIDNDQHAITVRDFGGDA